MQENIILSISILVSNRIDTIKRCMESIQPLLKQVSSELIVVDTVGEENSDGSLAIAKKYADRVVHFPWCNDFAAARNAGLSLGKGKWFLYLDDDEWFEDVSEIIEFFQSGDYKNYNSGYYYVHNYRADGTFTSAIVGRMIRLTSNTRFVGRVHENFSDVKEPHKQFSCYVNHSGYVFKNEKEREEHQKRNLSLLCHEMEKYGKTPMLAAQTVQELYSIKTTQKEGFLFCLDCIKELEKCNLLEDSCSQWLLVASARYYLMIDDCDSLLERANYLESNYQLSKVAQLALAALVARGAAPVGRLQTLEAAVETYLDCMDWCKKNPKQALVQTQLDFPKYMEDSYYLEMLRVGAIGANYQKDFIRANFYWEKMKQIDGGFKEEQVATEYRKTIAGLKEAKQTPLLTISLLVSNRKDTVRKCLESIRTILEFIPSELIIVDTVGEENSDGSLEIAKEYTNHIIRFTWCNDFSAARNAGLKEAKGKWFLYLDDDEWFEDVTEIIDFFQSGAYKNYERVWYVQRNYLDLKARKWQDAVVDRMCVITPETHFESRIHEAIVPLPEVKAVKKMTCYVHHFGYVFSNLEEQKKHIERNVNLLLKQLEEFPEDTRMAGQLAQEYMCDRQYEKAVEFCDAWLEQYASTLKDAFTSYLLNVSLEAEMALSNWNNVIRKTEYIRENKIPVGELLKCAMTFIEANAAVHLEDDNRIKRSVKEFFEAREQIAGQEEKLIAQLAFDMDKYLSELNKQRMQSFISSVSKKSAPASEFLELAKQLKYNIRMLISAGNKAEAKELLQGLREIISEDEEIKELEDLLK